MSQKNRTWDHVYLVLFPSHNLESLIMAGDELTLEEQGSSQHLKVTLVIVLLGYDTWTVVWPQTHNKNISLV